MHRHNLLANAIEAIDAGGTIGVEWKLVGGGGELSVWDTGPVFTGDPSVKDSAWVTWRVRSVRSLVCESREEICSNKPAQPLGLRRGVRRGPARPP
jgi:hypothetical protein